MNVSAASARRPLQALSRLLASAGFFALCACGGGPGDPPEDAQAPGDAALEADGGLLRDAGVQLDAALRDDAALGDDAALRDAESPEAPPITVAVIADLNASYGSTTYGTAVHGAVANLVGRAPDLVLSAGDMVAGQRSGLDYEAMWAGFHQAVTDPLTNAGIPLAVTPGNHDASAYAGFVAERAEYEAQWLARRPAVTFLDDAAYPFRYAFSVGPVLFVSLDATRVGPLSAEQLRWLDAVLALYGPAHEATVVFGHLPLHAVAEGVETQNLGDDALEETLETHRVALFVSGHHHAYYPGRRGVVRHLAMGCLGSGPRALVGTTEVSARSLAVFTVHRGEIVALDAFPASSFDTPIARDALPESIGAGASAYIRDDL